MRNSVYKQRKVYRDAAYWICEWSKYDRCSFGHQNLEEPARCTHSHIVTYIIEELNQRVGSQLSVILDDFIVSEDINTLHLIQTLSKRRHKKHMSAAHCK